MCLLFLLLTFQRYYYYIHHGIDTEHVAPMEDVWLENVLSLISENLKVSSNKAYFFIFIPFSLTIMDMKTEVGRSIFVVTEDFKKYLYKSYLGSKYLF